MNELSDEELQELANGKHQAITPGTNADLEAYRLLFEALDTPPPVALSANFASGVAARLASRRSRLEDARLYAGIALVFGALLAGGWFYLRSAGSGDLPVVFLLALKYKWLLLFGVTVTLLIQFADEWLVRAPQTESAGA